MSVDTIKATAKSDIFSPSTLDLDMNRPEVANKIMRKYSSQYRENTLAEDFRLMGNSMGISADAYTLFQEGWYWENIKIGVAYAGGDNSTDLTPDADSISTDGIFIKPGHILMFKSTNQTAYVSDVDYGANTFTAVANDGETLPAIAEDEYIMVGSNAFGEASEQPKPSLKKYDKLTYYLQRIKDTSSISGDQATNETWVDFSAYDVPFDWYNELVADADARMDRQESWALMFGDGGIVTADATMVANGLADAVGDEIRKTKGMVPLAQSEGTELATDATIASYVDFQELDDYYRTQGDGSHYIMGRLGHKLARAYSQSLFDGVVSGNGTDVTGMLMANGMDEQTANARSVLMKFMQYEDSTRCFMFKTADEFSDPKGYGTVGYNHDESGIWTPVKRVEGVDGGTMANITMLHKELGAYNRRREFFELLGAGGNTTRYNITKDVMNAYMKSHIGLAAGAPNLLVYSNPNA